MPITNNLAMFAAGFGPAARVARAMTKSLSYIHRLCSTKQVKSTRDGTMLYVDLNSLASYYEKQSNKPLAVRASALRAELIAEAKRDL